MQDDIARRKTLAQRELEEADLQQKQIADELQLSEPTISRILAGTYRIRSVRSRRTVARVRAHIAARLGRTVEDLFSDTTTAAASAA